MTPRELLAAATPRPWPDGGSRDFESLLAQAASRDLDGGNSENSHIDIEIRTADLNLMVRAVNEYEVLLDIADQMEREHAHHHIPGTADCHGCGLLAKLDALRRRQ